LAADLRSHRVRAARVSNSTPTNRAASGYTSGCAHTQASDSGSMSSLAAITDTITAPQS
jgi:hypothetical protein